jgi:hypothetical protein
MATAAQQPEVGHKPGRERLSDKRLEKLVAPPGKRLEIADTLVWELRVRVGKSGKKSWSILYRVMQPDGKRGEMKRLSLGAYPQVSLSEARQLAREALEQAEKGIDPAAVKEAEVEQRQTRAFEVVFERFVELHVKQNTKEGRFARERAAMIEKAKANGTLAQIKGPKRAVGRAAAERIIAETALPKWRGRLIETISRAEIHDLLDDVIAEDGVSLARELRKHLTKMFNWATDRGYMPASPMSGLRRPELGYNARDRVLSMEELRRVWDAAGDIGYAARVGAWRLPELAGISTIPTMREDGSIAAEDGYDPASRLIINKQDVSFPPVPDAPTKEDAERALELLIDPISQFPFVLDDEDAKPCGNVPSASRSAALSMMLTAVARHAISAAPIFGLSAPSMETGKSLLADIPAMMVTGRRAAMISQGESEEEDAKRLLSILMRGDPVNVIDNITREVSGDALATIITEEKWSQRFLGQNKMVEVSTKAVFIANGNNLVFREDMAVRALMVSLDARMERPGERSFDRDLRKWVPANRAALVVAALTILRAYVVAGRPRGKMKASRFTDWSNLIRGALVWLGEPDPLDTQDRVSAGDSARADLVALMVAMRDEFGPGVFTSCGEIIAKAGTDDRTGNPPGPLALALGAACPGRGTNSRALGKYLKSKVGRRHEGMYIKAHENNKNGNRYAVMVEADEPAQGELL